MSLIKGSEWGFYKFIVRDKSSFDLMMRIFIGLSWLLMFLWSLFIFFAFFMGRLLFWFLFNPLLATIRRLWWRTTPVRIRFWLSANLCFWWHRFINTLLRKLFTREYSWLLSQSFLRDLFDQRYSSEMSSYSTWSYPLNS